MQKSKTLPSLPRKFMKDKKFDIYRTCRKMPKASDVQW